MGDIHTFVLLTCDTSMTRWHRKYGQKHSTKVHKFAKTSASIGGGGGEESTRKNRGVAKDSFNKSQDAGEEAGHVS